MRRAQKAQSKAQQSPPPPKKKAAPEAAPKSEGGGGLGGTLLDKVKDSALFKEADQMGKAQALQVRAAAYARASPVRSAAQRCLAQLLPQTSAPRRGGSPPCSRVW